VTGEALVARTRRVDHDLDLLALAGSDGVLLERSRVGLAGRGVARRVPVAAADAALAAIETDDQVGIPGTGAVAFGALPFRPDDGAELVIPQLVWGRAEDGTRWVTTITPPSASEPDVAALCRVPVAAPARLPGEVIVRPVQAAAWWCELVARATKAIGQAGPDGLRKVVLAREVLVDADVPFDRSLILSRLRTAYPGCFLFHVEGFLGASPELLLQVVGDRMTTHPIAGTRPRGGTPAEDDRLADELRRDPKERAEHVMLVDLGRNDLGRVARPGTVTTSQYMEVERYSHVLHLVSHVEAKLKPELDALDALRSVFPAGTLTGAPKIRAMQLIAAAEGECRGLYGGAVGYLGYDGNLDTAITIRSAVLKDGQAHVHTGAGIVARSVPELEFEETEHKAAALRRAIELAAAPAAPRPAADASTVAEPEANAR